MASNEATLMHGIRPHIRSSRTTKEVMTDVVIALMPAFLGSIYFFGVKSIILVLASVTACALSEYLWQKLRKEQITVGDCSSIVTGMLLAFNFPVTTPLWIVLVASVFSIIIVKQLFGGIGNNFANPALIGRAIIMLLWPGNIAQYITTNHSNTDAISSATVLSLLKSGQEIADYTYLDMFIGNIPGALGETSKLLLLLGFLYLCYRQVVNLGASITYLITVVAITFVFGKNGFFTGDILTNLLGGGLILGACFMITDYPSVSPRVKVAIAFVAGLVTAGIRIWGILPEGVCFGILVGNCLSGFLDRVIKPHIYGVGVKKNFKKIYEIKERDM